MTFRHDPSASVNHRHWLSCRFYGSLKKLVVSAHRRLRARITDVRENRILDFGPRGIRLSLVQRPGLETDTRNWFEMPDDEGFSGGLTLSVNANAVAPAFQGMRKQGNLVFSKNKAAALFLIAVILLDRIKMLMTLLTNEQARQAIPHSCVSRIHGNISKL
ncbi:MAG: hypothetical protein ABJN75_07710 [Hoeflea sp.]|uniref:hypothetical protein n=1 Tax=Hoeflea sp. TaxID=1940281 RepID=UPI003298B479